MTLIIHELTGSDLVQEMTPDKNTFLKAIRPHIYRHNMPAGDLKIQVLDSLDVLVGESEVIPISSIGTLSFFHGYVRFFIDIGLKKDETYKIKLVGLNGYTFSESAYIGWCNDYDLGKYPMSFVPENLTSRPMDLEIWERKNI